MRTNVLIIKASLYFTKYCDLGVENVVIATITIVMKYLLTLVK